MLCFPVIKRWAKNVRILQARDGKGGTSPPVPLENLCPAERARPFKSASPGYLSSLIHIPVGW